MSLESWKAEFYPVEARDVPKERAAAHSLKKWEGLRKEELEKHECELTHWGDVQSRHRETFYIIGQSCALCVHFAVPWKNNNCLDCPLSKARGGVSCDSCRRDEAVAPYQALKSKGPEPMIGWLKKTMELEEAKAGVDKSSLEV